ncbi:MAG: hypothetical protein HeimC2_30250 [Candidatus Heimdallarchaeota archaeon LC_2]|nr:MAG: hypothetical protein HeimC2_30250 [Candidatus Heimdallarchaeota archaeon LC_2]
MKHNHLNEETQNIMKKSKKTKLAWCRKDHFISYGKAEKTLRYLEWVISQPQEPNTDLDSISIIGASGMGKTTIVKKFQDDHNSELNLGDAEQHIVAHCVLPDADLGLKGMYVSILQAKPFHYPVSVERMKSYSVIQLEKACVNLLKQTGVRILFVDEIQHALSRRIETTLNSLKRVVLLSGVPLVPVGTEKAKEVFLLDEQLADRCPTKSFSELKGWKNDIELRKFLAGYEKYLPFPKPSNLSSTKISREIFALCIDKKINGTINLRRVSRLLKAVSAMALRENADCININYLTKYQEEFL